MFKLIRDGKRVWPYCPECGCRVFYHKLWGAEYFAHALKDATKDRQNHKCSLIDGWMHVTPEMKEAYKHIGV